MDERVLTEPPGDCKPANELSEIARREIAANGGALPFARFMELALYFPSLGYYEQNRDSVGRGGDFYTNVSVGPLFGEMLAFQFAEWLDGLTLNSQHSTLSICEAGAHDGKLAADILRWLRAHRPELFERLEYVILEPSVLRGEWQRESLVEFSPHVRWHNFQLSTFNFQLSGIIFSNELLDAMPVHRFGWDAKQKSWFEWGVAVEGGRFVWTKIRNSEFGIRNSELEAVLPDGYTIEASPAAEAWWRQAAVALKFGKLVTIDYGFSAEEMFRPERRDGTLRAYHQHRLSNDPLANVGRQDLTAHVNFPAIQAVGESAGLKAESFQPQSQFLTRLAEKIWKNPAAFGEWTPARTHQFQTLTHPEHLGRAFRVLVQSR